MKDQLSRVTTELHSNTTSVGTLNEKTTELEQQLGTEREEMEFFHRLNDFFFCRE